MITPNQFIRLFTIQRTLIRHGVDEMILATPLLKSMQFLLYLLPWNWSRPIYAPRAERIRNVLEELGPIWVKFGQILSTRRDLLPDEIALELAKLQDAVPPFPGRQAREIVERAYGHPLADVFGHFDETPLASASIAQVHAATLLDGREVIVKVVRPGIRKTIDSDLGLMRILADAAERYSRQGKQLRPSGVIEEFEKTIIDELDLVREAANAAQIKRNFQDSPLLYVPEVNWELTRRNVMVMERISGIPVDDVEALRAAGVDLKALAEAGVGIFFTQVFRDHFFHADMHPGNLFVRPGVGEQPAQYMPVDFGIMGSLSEFDQRYLAENFMAFLQRDYRRVARLHVESGWVPKDTRVDDFEFAIRTVCEPIFDRPIKEISFGNLLLGLFRTAQRFHMEILPQLLLLQKTLVNIEGVGRQLYPELDIWAAARPSLEHWVKNRAGVRRLLQLTRDHLPIVADRLPEVPGMLIDVIDKMRSGGLEVKSSNADLTELRRELRRGSQRTVFALIGIGLLIAAALFSEGLVSAASFGDLPFTVWVMIVAGALLIVNALRR